jgi:Skp family chaperone for outer membrane proteins
MRYLAAATTMAALLFTHLPQASAQQNPGYFMPPGAAQGGGRGQARPAPPPQQHPAPLAAPVPVPQQGADAGDQPPPLNIQLPPPPELPPLPKGSPPPMPVIGVLGVPEVFRSSVAVQQVERALAERRQKLNEDAQREQAAWRDLQQALANQRGGMTADQVRNKERDLQERITNAQRQFRDRNRIIQEAAQYAQAQVERTLVAVIRQVADSRGMNLVLQRSQVALNTAEFDLTEQVGNELNKVMASVSIPPDGVSVAQFVTTQPPAAVAAPGGAAPAAAPAPGTPASPAPATPAAAPPAAAPK